MEPPGPPPAADVIVVESTYGNRRHEPDGQVLADAIRRTVQRGGSVLIPAFAVDRTEVLLQALRRLVRLGEIPDLPGLGGQPDGARRPRGLPAGGARGLA